MLAIHTKRDWPAGEIGVPHLPSRLELRSGLPSRSGGKSDESRRYSEWNVQRLLTQFETDSISEDSHADGEGWTASVDTIGPRIETHWSRILYYDLFDADRDQHHEGRKGPLMQ